MADETQTGDVLEFTTKPKDKPEADTGGEGLTISLDGIRMTARRPKNAVFAMLGGARGTQQRLSMLFDLLRAALSESDWAHVQDRLNDADDGLDIEDVADMAAKLAERWADETKAAAAPKRARTRR